MKFENTYVGNFEGAFRGMRLPMNSFAKADSDFGIGDCYEWLDGCANEVANSYLWDKDNNYISDIDKEEKIEWLHENGDLRFGKHAGEYCYIGKNDLDLAQRLIKGGSPHDKFLRQIFVSVDITAPFYLWKELDQYKVGTVTDSESTMHRLASKPITMDCFEMDDYEGRLLMYEREPYDLDAFTDDMWESVINYCETLRQSYLKTKDQRYWKELIRILPEGWLQKRQWTANYSVVRAIVHQRDGHRLTEWNAFIDWTKTLPYANELLLFNNIDNN